MTSHFIPAISINTCDRCGDECTGSNTASLVSASDGISIRYELCDACLTRIAEAVRSAMVPDRPATPMATVLHAVFARKLNEK